MQKVKLLAVQSILACPTSELAERVLAALEGAGCACAVFASGRHRNRIDALHSETLLLQRLIRGDIGLILDAKRRMSYPWMLKDMDGNIVQLPNIAELAIVMD